MGFVFLKPKRIQTIKAAPIGIAPFATRPGAFRAPVERQGPWHLLHTHAVSKVALKSDAGHADKSSLSPYGTAFSTPKTVLPLADHLSVCVLLSQCRPRAMPRFVSFSPTPDNK
jgi:hypothetical protein